MKKILLIGDLNVTLESVNECIMKKYQTQMCSENVDNISSMMRIVKPDLLLVSQIGLDDERERPMFEFIAENCSKFPVLVISTTERKESVAALEEAGIKKMQVIFRPISKRMLIDGIHLLLGDEEMEERKRTVVTKDGKRTVMIVDDSAMMLRNMSSMLKDKYDVVVVKSGEQAMKMIPKHQPDVILLDYEMPGWDGKQTFEAIRGDEYAKDIPVIFLTGIKEKDRAMEVLKMIPDGYILKPPSVDRIHEEIEAALQG